MRHPSYWCKTFGQEFQRPDKTFYPIFPVTCQWDKTWSTSTIAHTCQCENKLSLRFHFSSNQTFLGSKCVTPPLPPNQHNLIAVWDETNPPGRTFRDVEDAFSVISGHGSMLTYKCSAGGVHNRLTSDFNLDTYNLTCLPDNQFSNPAWPTCAASIRQV